MQDLARAGAQMRLQELRAEIAALERLLRGSGGATPSRGAAPRRRARRRGQLSAAGRAAIVAAQKARWAKTKAQKSNAAPASERSTSPARTRSRRRKTMSAAARKAVSARMRKYWAERRKAAGSKGGGKASAASKR
ncbi:MAG TPA: hypothetical protein VKD69_24720 [Vicinamibacterales bacterium]|nr:hypothetical protein [Vicinamibacterales bacterium]